MKKRNRSKRHARTLGAGVRADGRAPPAKETSVSRASRGSSSTGRATTNFPIVGIGASAGGLEAFTDLLKHLPLDTGMGFVLVQHLDPVRPSALTELLSKATSLPVREVTNNLRVQPNHISIIPPNTSMTIAGGVLKLQPRQETAGAHRSIDFFFESLAHDQHEWAIGVVLSGAATDGTLGLEAIKAEGGITFAQDESAKYDSMPRSAVAAGCVDFALAPKQIAQELARIARHPSLRGARVPRVPIKASGLDDERSGKSKRPSGEDGFKKILLLLRNHRGVDFSLYKSSTIQRRITRRMVLNKSETLQAYARFLRGNQPELDALYSDMLISVTAFFRNPEAFAILQRKVFPKIISARRDEPLRVWTLGCSTGQEAYSLAMAFTEYFDGLARAPRLQIFASDLNEAVLEKARAGLYPKSTVQDISPKRLRRFFNEEDGGYRISKALRDTVVFARQNILSDPPFSRIDLLVCRNLLIYLEPGLQKRIMSIFHYALKPKGCLFLGAAEGVGGSTDQFEPLDRKHKIFIRKAGPSPMPQKPFVTRPRRGEKEIALPVTPRAREDSEINLQREADRVTLNRFAPIGVLVNAELHVLQFRGDTSAFLQPPPGRATFHVLKMARDGLLLPLRAALAKAKKENRVVRTENVRLESKNGSRAITLEVAPLKNVAEPCYLIFFEEGAPKREKRKTAGAAVTAPASLRAGQKKAVEQSDRIVELETELGETRDYLQAIREQSEAAREELQASNEEVTSANEELQSVNEELETSKEELESANEELTTVNDEMANRNSELNRLNTDLVNLQTSTKLAIILLGRELTIRSFSAQAEKQFNLLASDVGRPLSKVRHNLDLPDLEKFIAGVIHRAREREREVQDKKGRWFSLRARPYLTLDKKVDGAVLVLVDIDALKKTELKITAARNYAEAIIRTERDPLIVLGPDLRVFSASEAFLQTFQLTLAETKGQLLYELAGGAWNLPRLRELLQAMIREESFFDDFEVTRDFARIGPRTVLLNARILQDESGEPARILLSFQDISKRKQVEEALREAGERLRFMAESMPQKIFTANAKGDVNYFNQQWTEFTGLSFEQIKGWGWKKFIHPDDLEETVRRWQHALDTGEPFELQLRFRRADGVYRWHVSRALPLRDLEGRITMWIGSSPDIDDQKHTEERLRDSETRVRALFESAEAARVSAEAAKTRAETATRAKDDFLAALSHELRTPLNPALLLATSLADDAALPPRLRTDIDVIAKAIALQAQLIDDMLDITRITTGKLRLTLQAIDAHGALRQAYEILRSDLSEREIEITLDLAASKHFIKADPVRVQQIFWNVLKNAVKFTPPGGAIAVRTRNPAESAGMLLVEVADTGVGIEPEMLGRVFDAFIQEEHVGAHRFGGVGLGLAITRRLVEVQNGRIRVASPGRNRGATFQIELPLEAPGSGDLDEVPRLQPGAAPAKACRILLVEDHELTRATLVRLLERRGHEVVGVATVAAARQFAATREFDLVISDLGLPDGDGHVLMAGLRDDHGLIGIALSGYGMEEDLVLSCMSGFFTHLTKPVDIHALDAAIAAASASGSPRDSAEST